MDGGSTLNTHNIHAAQMSTPRTITGAPSRGAGRDEAAVVLMRRPSAPTARVPMGRGPMSMLPRKRPANSRGGGDPPPALGAGIMAVWQVALVKQLRIMGSNPSRPHILAEDRRKAEEWRKAMGGRTGFSAP